MKIIYEDKDKIIVDKPSGQLSQSGKNFDVDLVSEVLSLRKSRGEEVYAAIINRLDRPVSGLVLIAKTKQAAAIYSNLMKKEGGFNKQYVALVCGKIPEEKGELVDYLYHDKKDNTAKVVDRSNPLYKESKLAKLTYEVLAYDEKLDISYVRIHLFTGRHHQIRVQFASRGHELVGDGKYSRDRRATGFELMKNSGIKRNQIALCAVELTVQDKTFVATPEFKTIE